MKVTILISVFLTVFGFVPAKNEGEQFTVESAVFFKRDNPAAVKTEWANDSLIRYKGPENQWLYFNAVTLREVPGAGTPSSPKFFEKEGSVYFKAGLTSRVISKAEGCITYGTVAFRHEFGTSSGIFPSPSGKKVAYYKKDESKVGRYPIVNYSTQHGAVNLIPYPQNGTDSEIVELMIFDSVTGKTVMLDDGNQGTERYITNVCWKGDNFIYAQILDRSQHHLKLQKFNANTGKLICTVLEEKDEAWVEPLDPVHFIGNLIIYTSEQRDGYRNLYLCDDSGHIKRLSPVQADMQFKAVAGRSIYFTSAAVSPDQQHLFRVKVSGAESIGSVSVSEPEGLTLDTGWHEIEFNQSGTRYFEIFSSVDCRGWMRICDPEGHVLKEFSNDRNAFDRYAHASIEFGSVKSADGRFDNFYRLIKPADFDASKKYPLLVYVYGGPHSQMVKNSWLAEGRLYEEYLAQLGYIVYVQDNRGTDNHGADYRKAINRACGQAEMADQLAGLQILLKNPWIDRDRIGVFGWSYGGFMSLTLATSHPEIFKAAVAGGPVIDWNWYEIMYGERYMDTEKDNPEGFALTRLQDKASKLGNCKVLICQGMSDDTVTNLNSLSFFQSCIDAGKHVEYLPFPKALHNMTGSEAVYLYTRITEFIVNNL